MHQNFFANRSIYAALGLATFTLLSYRIIYIIITAILYIFGVVEIFSWQLVFITAFWEIIFTVSIVGILYLIFSKFTKLFNSTIIESSIFRYEHK